MSPKPILTVVLGAGFSAGFGIPVASGLRDLFLTRCTKYDSWNLIRFDEYPLSEFLDGRYPDIELFLSFWESYHAQLDDIPLQHTQDYGSYRFILENLCYHLAGLGESADSSALFGPLAEWLDLAIRRYEVRFVTMNYDLVVERLCNRLGVSWDYFHPVSGTITIRKPHGSINWFRSKFEQTEALFQHVVSVNGERFYCPRDLGKLEWNGEYPIIIPPIAGKRYDPVFRVAWQFAQQDILAADRILIVGYRFPAIDVFAEWTLGRHALRRKADNIEQYVLLEPSDADRERVRSIIGRAELSDEAWQLRHFTDLLD